MRNKSLITPGNSASYRGTRAVVRHPSVSKYGGKALSQGQVFMLLGSPNDDRLVRLGFVQLLNDAETFSCRVCGSNFAAIKNGPNGQSLRDRHAFAAHEATDKPQVREAQATDIPHITEDTDRHGEPKFKIGGEPDPRLPEGGDLTGLYLDQTAASRGVKADTPIEVNT